MESIEFKLGKYYQSGNSYIRVDTYDSDLEPVGVEISFFKDHVNVTNNADLFYFKLDKISKEITKEEFEEKLEQAHTEFIKLTNEIKNNPTI